MSTEFLYATSHEAGDFVNPNNALGNTPSTWAGELNTNANVTSRWAIGNPSEDLEGTQTIRVVARKGSNSGNPDIQLNLYENGSLVQALGASVSITSTSGQTITRTFAASAITNKDNVEIEVVMSAQGGNQSTRNSAQVSHIEWEAAIIEVGPPTEAPVLSSPSNTHNSVNLSWTSVSGAATYELQRKLSSEGAGSWVTIQNTAATTRNDTGLSSETDYDYRVRAVNGSGEGPWSNELQVTTDAPPPPEGSWEDAAFPGSSSNVPPVVHNGATYAFMVNKDQDRVYVYKSTDPEDPESWVQVGDPWHASPADECRAFSIQQVGNLVYTSRWDSTGEVNDGGGNFNERIFDLSIDDWDGPENQHDAVGAYVYSGTALAVRSNGNRHLFYAADSISPDWVVEHYWHDEFSEDWLGFVDGEPGGGSSQWMGHAANMEADFTEQTWLVYHKLDFGFDRSIRLAIGFSTFVTFQAELAQDVLIDDEFGLPIGNQQHFTPICKLGDNHAAIAYISDMHEVKYIEFSDGGVISDSLMPGPVISSNTRLDEGRLCAYLVFDGTDSHYLYVRNSDGSLCHKSSSDGWTTDTEVSQGNGQMVSAIWDDDKIKYLWDDNGVLTYGEFDPSGEVATGGTFAVTDETVAGFTGSRTSDGVFATVDSTEVAFVGSRDSSGSYAVSDETIVEWVGSVPANIGSFAIVDETVVAFDGSRDSVGSFPVEDDTTVEWIGSRDSTGSFSVEDESIVQWSGLRDSTGSFVVADESVVEWSGFRDSTGSYAVDDEVTVGFIGSATEPPRSGTFAVSDETTVEWIGSRDSDGSFDVEDNTDVTWVGIHEAFGVFLVNDDVTVSWTGGIATGGSFAVSDDTDVEFNGSTDRVGSFDVEDDTDVEFIGSRDSDGAFAVDDETTVAFIGEAQSTGEFSVVDETVVEWSGAIDYTGVFGVLDITDVEFFGVSEGAGIFSVIDSTTVEAVGSRSSDGSFDVVDETTVEWLGSRDVVGSFAVSDETVVAFIGGTVIGGVFAITDETVVDFTGTSETIGTFAVADDTNVVFLGGTTTRTGLFAIAVEDSVEFVGSTEKHGTFGILVTDSVSWNGLFPVGIVHTWRAGFDNRGPWKDGFDNHGPWKDGFKNDGSWRDGWDKG